MTVEGDSVRLVLTRNFDQDRVVLSPIVLNHWPRSMDWFEPGTWGWVHFDCIMDTTVNPKTVVRTTGVDVAISEAEWWTPHGIKFLIPEIPDLQQHCFVGFQVDPNLARSKHNHSMLDGNTNPGRRNGVSPNGDYYNWTCACDSEVLNGYMDFEEGVDARPIPDTLGWRFIPGEADVWRYGDRRTGNYSIYPWSDYYWCDGNFFGGIPFTDAFGVELTGTTARSVCLGASSNSEWLYLWALDSTLITVVDIDSMPANTKTHSLSLMTVRGERIGRIVIYGDRNSFLVDNLTVFDICGDAMGLIRENYEPIIRDIEILQLNDELHFPFPVAEYAESLQIVVNCLPEDMPQGGIRIVLNDPGNSPVLDKEITAPPFLSDPIPNPVVGGWDIAVRALQSQQGTCPIAAVAATRNAPRVDYLIQDSLEVWWYPSTPKYGETITVFSKIHCNDELEYSQGVEFMPVRCSLNSPTGEQIDNEDYAASLVPGGVDTDMFSFDTHLCTQPEHCRVYIDIDPDNQIPEYSELNNVRSRQITFAP